MRRRLGALDGKRVVIVGDVLHSRVARSNLWTLLSRARCDALRAGDTPPANPRRRGERGRVEVTTNFDDAVKGADVVMTLRMQKGAARGRAHPFAAGVHRRVPAKCAAAGAGPPRARW